MHGARRAHGEDLPVLIYLLGMAMESTPVDRGADLFGLPQRSDDKAARITDAMNRDDATVLAGTIDDVVVGMALVSAIGDVATIEELHVEPPAREVGVGESLIDAAVAWATAAGARAIDYPALPGDRATKNLGERSGFVARLIVMHRNLRGDRPG